MSVNIKDRLIYEVVCNGDPCSWLAEAIDHGSEGEVYSAIFEGPDAERRAREYAAWKNGGTAQAD